MPAASLPRGMLRKTLKIRTQGNLSACTGVELSFSFNIIYSHSETAPSEPESPHDRSLTITLRHTHTHTHSVGVLWKSDQPETQNCTWQHTTLKRDSHPCYRVVRTHNPSRPAAADTRLRPRCQWDRSLNILGRCNSLYNLFWTAACLVLVLCRLFQLALTAIYLVK
jgi:hypothetical protein